MANFSIWTCELWMIRPARPVGPLFFLIFRPGPCANLFRNVSSTLYNATLNSKTTSRDWSGDEDDCDASVVTQREQRRK